MPKKDKKEKEDKKEKKNKKELNNFDALKEQLEKSFGKIVEAAKPVKRVSTTIPSFDYLFGSGLPLGRIVEFFGQEGSGKSLLATQMMSAAQFAGLPCALIDMERSFDSQFATELGLSVEGDKFLRVCPAHAQQAFDVMYRIAKLYKVIVVDSVAAMVPEEEIAKEGVSWGFSKQPLIMAAGLRKLIPIIAEHGSTVVFVNQLRAAFAMFSQEESPGGRALKFYSSLRLRISTIGGKKGAIEVDGERVGHMIRVEVAKTKCSSCEHEVVEIPVIYKRNNMYSIGVDRIFDLFYLAVRLGVLNPHNRKFGPNEVCLGQNRDQALMNLRVDQDLLKQLKAEVYLNIKER